MREEVVYQNQSKTPAANLSRVEASLDDLMNEIDRGLDRLGGIASRLDARPQLAGEGGKDALEPGSVVERLNQKIEAAMAMMGRMHSTIETIAERTA